jgi:hypothetical protein
MLVESNPQVPFDVSAERAEAILRQLEELGLIVPAHRVEDLVQERLREHGIPACRPIRPEDDLAPGISDAEVVVSPSKIVGFKN